MKTSIYSSIALLLMAVTFTSCNEDDPETAKPTLVTTLQLKFSQDLLDVCDIYITGMKGLDDNITINREKITTTEWGKQDGSFLFPCSTEWRLEVEPKKNVTYTKEKYDLNFSWAYDAYGITGLDVDKTYSVLMRSDMYNTSVSAANMQAALASYAENISQSWKYSFALNAENQIVGTDMNATPPE